MSASLRAQTVIGNSHLDVVPQFLRSRQGYEVAVSPNGKLALIGNDDASITVWDTQKDVVIRHITDLPSPFIKSLGFLADGETAYVGNQAVTTLIETKTWTIKKKINQTVAAFFPDSKRMLLSSSYNWWVADIEPEQKPTSVESKTIIEAIALSPDGKLVITGDREGQLRIYDVESRQVLKQFQGAFPLVSSNGAQQPRMIKALAFSQDGTQVFCGSALQNTSSGEMRVFDLTGKEMGRLGEGLPSFKLNRITPLIGGGALASGYGLSKEDRPRIWTEKRNSELLTEESVNGAASLPNNRLLLALSGTPRVAVFDINTGQPVRTFGSNCKISKVATSKDGATVYTTTITSRGTDLIAWDTKDWSVKQQFSFLGFHPQFSPDGSMVTAPSSQVRIFNTNTGGVVHELQNVRYMQFSVDGKTLFGVSHKPSDEIFAVDLQTGTKLWTNKIESMTGYPTDIHFSPSGHQIIWTDRGHINLYDREQGKKIWEGEGPWNSAEVSVWLPDEQSFLIRNNDYVYDLRSTKTGELLRAVGPRLNASGATLSPDGLSLWVWSGSDAAILDIQSGSKKTVPFRFDALALSEGRIFTGGASLNMFDADCKLLSSTFLLPNRDFTGNSGEAYTRWADGRTTTTRNAGATKMLKQNVNGVLVDFPKGPAPINTEASKAQLKAGEICFWGSVRSIDATTGKIEILASRFELPGGKWNGISPAKPKTIATTANSFIHPRGNGAKLSVKDLTVGRKIRVLGPDGGSGKALMAREIEVLP